MRIPRFLLTAGASGSGKTLITCGILQALKNRGLEAASFKCGPDYIDPMFHEKVIGTRSGNLDLFFTDEDRVRSLLAKNSAGCDVAVMEGVMGYYDGVGGTTVRASAYDLARATDTPALLLVNCKGMSLSILAYIKGFLEFREDSHIAGVLLNQLSPMMYGRIKALVEEELGIPVYGYIPRVEECALESRHLGLVLPDEVAGLQEKLGKLAEVLEETLDLNGILKMAGQAPDLTPWEERPFDRKKRVRIGLARDEAFCFIYRENLELLRELGAELVPFSPLHDRKVPEDLDGILLYGGYPELFGEELEQNRGLRRKLRELLTQGLPVMAECGGFMYLHDTFENMDGRRCAGLGVIHGNSYRTPRLSRFGYITLKKKDGRVFGKEIGPCPAHEFHYFDSTSCGDTFYAEKPESRRGWECMHCTDTMLAGFPHLYYEGNPALAEAFLEKCSDYKEERRKKQ